MKKETSARDKACRFTDTERLLCDAARLFKTSNSDQVRQLEAHQISLKDTDNYLTELDCDVLFAAGNVPRARTADWWVQ